MPASALAPGDRVLVRPGETLPADGVLESEAATLDEAWMTGESRPVAHVAGELLLGGSVNAGSAIAMKVARVGEATSISSIHRLMERALGAAKRTESDPIPINVDGAISAICGDIGLDHEFGAALFIISRVPGLIAHAHEERLRERPMRQIDPKDAVYDGPAERRLPERRK